MLSPPWVSALRAPAPAHAVVARIRTVEVRPGDTLWSISERAYGSSTVADFTRVMEANPTVIRDPQIIVAGQKLVLPPVSAATGVPPR